MQRLRVKAEQEACEEQGLPITKRARPVVVFAVVVHVGSGVVVVVVDVVVDVVVVVVVAAVAVEVVVGLVVVMSVPLGEVGDNVDGIVVLASLALGVVEEKSAVVIRNVSPSVCPVCRRVRETPET